MINEEINRSPLFYVGDKYKLVRELKKYFPNSIRRFVEPFVGGGSVYLNTCAEEYHLNDVNKDIIEIHKMLLSFIGKEDCFFSAVKQITEKYNLSYSFEVDKIPSDMKRNFMKTYYARFNKEGYISMRNDYNIGRKDNYLLLYVLMIYGFNRMVRFNSKGEFNLPVGNVDFNHNTAQALLSYFYINSSKTTTWHNLDFEEFLGVLDLGEEDLVYLDPPYLITSSEYNKLWDHNTEKRLLCLLDNLHLQGIRFAISNVTHYKDRQNYLFIDWAQKYHIHPIKSNYISYHDNSIKKFNEVLITNY